MAKTRVVYNLVENTVKYGSQEQTIKVVVSKPANDQVKVEIIDQGKGIPVNLQKKLFTKFGQLDSSSARSQGGTGLVLYICKLIIEGLGGKIGIKSEVGKGSAFFFTFPIVKRASNERK